MQVSSAAAGGCINLRPPFHPGNVTFGLPISVDTDRRVSEWPLPLALVPPTFEDGDAGVLDSPIDTPQLHWLHHSAATVYLLGSLSRCTVRLIRLYSPSSNPFCNKECTCGVLALPKTKDCRAVPAAYHRGSGAWLLLYGGKGFQMRVFAEAFWGLQKCARRLGR